VNRTIEALRRERTGEDATARYTERNGGETKVLTSNKISFFELHLIKIQLRSAINCYNKLFKTLLASPK